MAETELTTFHSMLGSLISGAAQGNRQAVQENDQDEQQQQQQAIQLAQLQNQQASQQRQDLSTQYAPLFSHLQSLTPESQAAVLGEYGRASAGIKPPDLSRLSGVFDKDSPLQSFFKAQGAPTAPAGGVSEQPYPYGRPQPVPTPGASPVQPTGVPTAPLAGGMPTPGMVAPGASTAAALTQPPVTFQTPGGATVTLGADPKQIAAARSDIQRLIPRFSAKELPPDFRQQVDGGIAQANAQLAKNDLEGARATIAQLEGLAAQVPAQAHSGRAASAQADAARYDRLTKEYGTRGRTGAGAYADIVQLSELEQRQQERAAQDPSLAAAGMDRLSGYGPQIDEMKQQFTQAQALRSKKDRTPSEDAQLRDLDRQWRSTAQDLRDMLRYTASPERKGQVLGQVRQFMMSLSPEQRTPENVAAMLDNAGAKDMAALVRERGLNFGGAQAEKDTISLVRGLANIMQPGTPQQVRDHYARLLEVQSTLAGHPISLDPAQLVRTKPVDRLKQRAADDAHQKALLEIDAARAKNAVEIKGSRWQAAELDLQTKQARLDQIKGKAIDPALTRSAVVKKLSGMNNDAKAQFTVYNNFLNAHTAIDRTTFDPEAWLNDHPNAKDDAQINTGNATVDSDTRAAVGLYRKWRTAVNAADNATDKVIKAQGKLSALGNLGSQQQQQRPAQRQSQAPLTPAQMRGMTTAQLLQRLAAKQAGPQ